MVGHRLVGSSALHTGDFADSRAHYDQALSLYRITRWREGNPYGVITLAEINQPGVSRRASERKQETIWRA
jgi:hypothetical protein